MKIREITTNSSQYPELLGEIPSPPKQLYCLGSLRSDLPLVSIVGSRKPTRYGRTVTSDIAASLAKNGIGIVSGLALGIDAEAHRAALTAEGYTLAVMASGLDKFYPVTNRQLGIRILKNGGAMISEYEEGTPPLKQHFPARNRIVAGLSQAVIVTEAAEKSGSLITANFALEQNRLVMAVPGNITSSMSRGTNNLIKAGAIPVTDANDVLIALGLDTADESKKAPLSEKEAEIIALIDDGVTDGEEMLVRLKWSASEFNQTITLMELSGHVRHLDGNKWIRS